MYGIIMSDNQSLSMRDDDDDDDDDTDDDNRDDDDNSNSPGDVESSNSP